MQIKLSVTKVDRSSEKISFTKSSPSSKAIQINESDFGFYQDDEANETIRREEEKKERKSVLIRRTPGFKEHNTEQNNKR